MKNIFFLIVLTSLFACKKQEVGTYAGKDGISFFAYDYEALHSTNVISFSFAFALRPQTRDTIYVRMRVTGKISDRPRTVQLKAVEGSTARAGIDYILPEATVPAGEYMFQYPVIVLNSPEMLTNTYRLVLEVAETNDFTLGSVGLTPATTSGAERNFKQLKMDINNQLTQPSYWSVGDFGVFSAVKYRFMVQVTGLTDFSEEAIGVDGSYNLPVRLRNALLEYEAVNGPLMDENNVRVSF
ncbi:MAG: DUF4843 domain-containing protein [Pedobacter sp.]|uniref:DUF4843 domain-containing protein n=1 Tax=Pedobacter sp. TaxID=1411316 RepID=UPI00356226E3